MYFEGRKSTEQADCSPCSAGDIKHAATERRHQQLDFGPGIAFTPGLEDFRHLRIPVDGKILTIGHRCFCPWPQPAAQTRKATPEQRRAELARDIPHAGRQLISLLRNPGCIVRSRCFTSSSVASVTSTRSGNAILPLA